MNLRRSTSPGPATLADHEAAGFKLRPRCRRCWHAGISQSAREFAEQHGLPMTTTHPEAERLLRCIECGERAGYLEIINPAVTV